MTIYFLLLQLSIFCCVAKLPESKEIELPFEIVTHLSEEKINISECKNEIKEVYAASFLFDSVKETIVEIVSNSTIDFDILIQGSNSTECNLMQLNSTFSISNSLQYRLIITSTQQLTENENIFVSIHYIPSLIDPINTVVNLPFYHVVSVPSNINSTYDICFPESTKKNSIYGYNYYIKMDSDSLIEINTCGYSDSLTAIRVITGNNNKCIQSIDTFETADLQCYGGIGSRLQVEIHPTSILEVHVGFISPFDIERKFLLNVTYIGKASEEQEDWELWMWFGIVTAIIIIVIVLIMVAIFVYEFIQKRKSRKAQFVGI